MTLRRHLYAHPPQYRRKDTPVHEVVREAIDERRNGDRSPVYISHRLTGKTGEEKLEYLRPPICLPLDNGGPCPECGYEFDPDEWECREVGGAAPTIGQTWKYTCPSCEQETASVGT